LVVLGIASYLRLSDLWLVQIKQDEAVLANRALTFLEGGPLPLAGNPSGAGVFNPPGFVYLISLAMAAYRHPIAASALLAGLGALAAVLTYVIGRRSFGVTAGLAAGLLYAANPWAIWHSRDIWEPDSVHFFVALFILTVLSLVVDRRPMAVATSTVLLAVLTQLHFSTIVLAPVWVFALALGRRDLAPRWLGVGVLVSVVLYVPYLYGEAASGWSNVHRLLAQPTSDSTLDLTAVELTLSTITDFSYFLPGDLAGSGRLAAIELWALREGMMPLVAVGALTVGCVSIRAQPRESRATWLLAAWLVLPVALTLRHWLTLQLHYYLIVLPALCLLAGLGARTLARAVESSLALAARSPRPSASPSRARAIAHLCAFLLVAAIAWTQTHATLVQRQHIRDGDRARFVYGVPLLYTSRLADYLLSQPDDPVEVIASHSYAAEALATLTRRSDSFTYFDGSRAIRLPTDPATAVVVLEDGTPGASLLDRLGSGWRVHEEMEAGRRAYSVYRLPTDAHDILARNAFAPVDAKFGADMRLLGVSYPRTIRPGEAIPVAAFWRVTPGRQMGADVSVAFVGLDSRDGGEIAKVQQHAHDPSMDARGGDWLGWITMQAPASLPDGAGWLTLGLFWSPDVRPIAVAASDGRPLGDRLRLGPVRLVGTRQVVAPPATRVGARLGPSVVLDGYDAEWQGSTLAVRLHWRASGKVDGDYQAFAHLTDARGRLLGQHDTQPGQIPTSLWEDGEVTIDAHSLSASSVTSPEGLRVVVGLYSLADGARLPVSDPDGSPLGDSLDFAAPTR
jgi:4-amino-4-deoxy-L-arabinose transferase-like glycosyltransferase